MKSTLRAVLVASVSVVATSAFAGGFINTSQSTVYNGMAYAGFAAGGGNSPSAMFMNPATMTQFRTFTSENNLFGIMPNTKITGTGAGVFTTPSGDMGQDAITPASYFIYPFSDRVVVGLAINAPFGLTTKPNPSWGGRLNSITTSLKTYNVMPSIAYKISETLSIGAGVQIQFAKAKIYSAAAAGLPPAVFAGLRGDGWGFGASLGVAWEPMKGTHIGLGWRSFIDQEIDGQTFAGAASANSKGKLNLPNRLNLSLRQNVNSQFDFLASIEWQNWARIGHARINTPIVPALGTLPFGYNDGWMFSVGGEYKWNQALTLRAGAAYEISPVTDQTRTTRLPDANRLWLSTGFSYDVSERFTVNGSYSHVFVKDANINIAAGHPAFTGVTYVGRSKAHVDIVSIGLTSRWGASPKKEDPLMRKY